MSFFFVFFNFAWWHLVSKLRLLHFCLPGCCTSPRDSEDKAVKLLHQVLLSKKPRRPSLNDWVSVEPVLYFLLMGQIGGALEQLYLAAHKHLQQNADEGLAEPAPCHRGVSSVGAEQRGVFC